MPSSRTRKKQGAGPKDSSLIKPRRKRRIYNPTTKTYYILRQRGKGTGPSIKGKYIHKEGDKLD